MLSARALRSFYFSMFSLVFFQGVWKPCIAGPKRLQTELTNITRQHFCSLPVFLYWTFLYLLSLIGIFVRYLLVLTYFDSSRRHTHATTHATGTQIVRAKMTSLEMTFCRGNKSSSRSPLSCRRKHKKSTLALRARERLWARLVGKSRPQCEMSSFIHFQLTKCRVETCFLSSVASDGKDGHELKLEKMGGVIWYGTFQPYMKNWANFFKF